MTIFYSPLKQAFYHDEINYEVLPEDIVAITPEQHSEFLHAMNMESKKVVLGSDGTFYFENAAVSATWEAIRSRRNSLLRDSDYTQVLDWPGDKMTWATWRQELRDLPQNYTNPEDVIFPPPPV